MSSIFAVVVLLTTSFWFSEAREFLVGGKTNSWSTPTSVDSLNQWASANRFQVGDYLVWKYGSKDSVLQVSKEDYLDCNTTNPVSVHKDGDTKIELNRSGPFYFINGAPGACEKGEKLVVVVLSEKHKNISRYPFAPAPAPTVTVELDGPAVAPSSGAGINNGSAVLGNAAVVWFPVLMSSMRYLAVMVVNF